ncbi:MAG: epoxyqueuosine reductase QueH, partial [bacterium]
DENNFSPTAYYYNPNIHPHEEFIKRFNTLKKYAEMVKLPLLVEEESYVKHVADFMQGAFGMKTPDRCRHCYQIRLKAAAQTAKKNKIEYFTTTLMISPYQDIDEIKRIGKQNAKEFGVEFVVDDFHKGYKRSRELSKAMGLYMQKYCGCIYSLTEKK